MPDVYLGSIVIDCNDLGGMTRFWQEVLGYQREVDESDWAKLSDPNERGATVCLQKVEEPRRGKNRLHIDLYSKDPTSAIARLTALGARVHPRTPEPDDDFVVLEDPEGNLFCVVDRAATNP